MLVEAQGRQVVDRALVSELQPDISWFDTGNRPLPVQRVLLMLVALLAVERARLRQLGVLLFVGEEVVLQAQAPRVARLEVDGKA